MKAKISLAIIACVLFAFSCKGQNSDNGQRNHEPPSVDELFGHMDEDEDGLLSEKEVKGPLKDMFSKIDANEDGFLSEEEVEEAPKPQGRRPR